MDRLDRLDVIAGVHQETVTTYRATGRDGSHVEHIGVADEVGLEALRRIVAVWAAGHPGWLVAISQEPHLRWVRGDAA